MRASARASAPYVAVEQSVPPPGPSPVPVSEDDKPATERVRAYLLDHPKASPGWIAAALKMNLRDVDVVLRALRPGTPEKLISARDVLRESVLRVLRASKEPLYAVEIAERTNYSYVRVRSALNWLEKHGHVTGKTLTRDQFRSTGARSGMPRRYYKLAGAK